MPISNNQRGRPGVLGYPRMAGGLKQQGKGGAPGRVRGPFRSVRGFYNTTLSGVTRDGSGTALGNCVVQVFRTLDDSFVAETVSDGTGNFSFSLAPTSGQFYMVAYLAGAPDVAGTTVNTLVAV